MAGKYGSVVSGFRLGKTKGGFAEGVSSKSHKGKKKGKKSVSKFI